MSSQTASPASSTTLEIHGLRKRFRRADDKVVVFDDLNLSVTAGEFVSIIGPSGCGKSTLLRLVCGLLDADAGSITINGETPAEARERKHFGFVPQTPALLPWKSVRQNVTLLQSLHRGNRLGDERVSEIIAAVGLAEVTHSLPGELSGGMQQRVSLARAFALRPPILLMDEPFSALDEITRSDMRYLLLDLWRDTGATILFVTHNIEEALVLSDRVLVMGGSPASIVANEAIALERPRSEGIEDSPDFHSYAARLRSGLFNESRDV